MNKTDKREDIMQVAMELIAERGFHDAPMSLIAKKAAWLPERFTAILKARMCSSQNCIKNWKK